MNIVPVIKDLINREDEYRRILKQRFLDSLIPEFERGIGLFLEWKKQYKRLQELNREMNRLSREFKFANTSLVERAKRIKQEAEIIEKRVKELEMEIEKIEIKLPNWLHPEVPIGVGDEYEKPINYVLKPKVSRNIVDSFKKLYPDAEFEIVDNEPLHHYNLVGTYIDQNIAGEVATSRFYYIFNELVILNLALSLYAIEFFLKKGYGNILMIPPYMMRRSIEERITYFEAFQDTIFKIEDDELILIPTSEHPIVAYFRNKTFNHTELPLRIIAWSACFRKEAGAHGKDTKGIFRVKQFHKVEIHSITRKDEDIEEVFRLTRDIQEFLKTLELPNRAVVVPSGDMDRRAMLQIDIQTWFPGQGRYRETHSIATVGTWISEKLKIKYRLQNNKKEYVRNVYATGVAVERQICAIVENHYDPIKNVVRVPTALQKYTLGIKEIPISKETNRGN